MERIEINPPAWKMALAILGIAAFVLVGAYMAVYGDLFEKAMGVIAILFFGGLGAYALYARSRGQGKIAILPAGIEVGLPGMNPRVLPWGDIEAFGVNKIVTGTALGVLAAVAVAAGEPEKAARLWGAAQAIFDAADYKLDKVDQDFVDRYVGEARASIGDEAYGAAFRGGRAMRFEHAVALARETR